MIKVFTLNKNNKIELTKTELQKLLDEAYWDGYRANNYYVWHSPTTTIPTITCATSNGSYTATTATTVASDTTNGSVTVAYGNTNK